MYDIEKHIPQEVKLYEMDLKEIPSFSTLAEKAEFKMSLELFKGKGAGRVFNYPVHLEPPFEYYEHINLTEIDEHFVGKGDWHPYKYPEYDLAHIRVLLNDEIQPQHIFSIISGLTGEQHISFEIIVKDEIKIYITLPNFLRDTLLSQLYTFFPHSQFQIEDQDPTEDLDDKGYPAYYLEYGLMDWYVHSLRIFQEPAPLTYLIGLLEELEGFGFLQIMAVKCKGIWEQNLDLCLRERYKFERIKFADFDVEKALDEKTKTPFYAVAFRIVNGKVKVVLA